MKVLVIDDAKIARHLLIQCLEKEGHEIIGEASDGKQGLDMYKTLKPDLVILDIEMPIVKGIECLEAILEFDDKAKVIMCTTLDQKELIILSALKVGAIGYITKPFEEGKVKKELEDIISNL